MPEFNQPRRRIIQLLIIATFFILVARLLVLQLVSTKYGKMAEENALYRKVVYPSRGIIFDRKRRAILNNSIMYDLIVTPNQIKNLDTVFFCSLMEIDKGEFRTRVISAIIKNGRVRPSVFEALLTPEKFARINENIYQFEGFTLEERPVRTYPWDAGALLLGYVGEVDTNFLKKHKEEGYQMGDYAGITGLERSYEKVLMGQRGIRYLLRDNKNRIRGSFEEGAFDTAAIAGRNLYTSIDIELQKFAEELMINKVGSVVAINPKTGGILTMVSSPTYNPNYLTGSFRKKHYLELQSDPRLPLLNRAVNATYPPGSTYKPMGALVALDEGVITPATGYACGGAYVACRRPVKCTHKGGGHAANLRLAIANSCNGYFSHIFRLAVDNPRYGNERKGLTEWKHYLSAFGLGHRLGVDITSEKNGNIPDTLAYDKEYRGSWNSCTNVTLGIGQDKMLATPIQLANAMCIIANKGYYYTPHFVDSIENETAEDTLLKPYRHKVEALTKVSDSAYEAIMDGMQGVVEYGTAVAAKVEGVNICAKTGTAENYKIINGKREKLKDNSMFVCFAPREKPVIAIAVIVENGGYGSTAAAPIASLLLEKYLRDSITAKRKELVDRMKSLSLIPSYMRSEMQRRDSIKQAREIQAEKLREEKELKDSLSIEDELEEMRMNKTAPPKQDHKEPKKPAAAAPRARQQVKNAINRRTKQ